MASFTDDLSAVTHPRPGPHVCKAQRLIETVKTVDAEWAAGFVEAFNNTGPDRATHAELVLAARRFAERHNIPFDDVPEQGSLGRCRRGHCKTEYHG